MEKLLKIFKCDQCQKTIIDNKRIRIEGYISFYDNKNETSSDEELDFCNIKCLTKFLNEEIKKMDDKK